MAARGTGWMLAALMFACGDPPAGGDDAAGSTTDAPVSADAPTPTDAPVVDAGNFDAGPPDASITDAPPDAPIDSLPGPDATTGITCNGDSAWLVYRAYMDDSFDTELYGAYVTPSSVGTSAKLNHMLLAEASIEHTYQPLQWSPDGKKLVYRVENKSAPSELWLIDLSGTGPGAPVQLNGYLESQGEVGLSSRYMAWSPDSTKLAYYADPSGEGPWHIHVVDVSGTTPTPPQSLLGPAMHAVSEPYGRLGFRWSPNSDWLLYRADALPGGAPKLYVSNVSGVSPGAPIEVNTGGLPETTTSAFEFSPNGQWIAYVAKQGAGVDQVYMAEMTASGPTAAATRSTTGASYYHIEWSPDSSALAFTSLGSIWVVGPNTAPEIVDGSYGADDDTFHWSPVLPWLAFFESSNLHVAWVWNGSPGSPELVASWSAATVEQSYKWSPDGSRILVRGQDGTSVQLWAADVGSSVVTRRVNGPLPAGGNVSDIYHFSPDSRYASYVADQDTDDVNELYVVDLDSPTLIPIKMNPPLTPTYPNPPGDVNKHAWSPSSTRIAYLADQVNDAVWEVWLVDVATGPGSVVKVNPLFLSGAGARAVSWGSCAAP